MSYLAAIAILVIWLPINARPSLAGLIIFALTFGFSSGAFVSLMTPCLVDICGGHTHDLGAMLGTFMSIIAFAYVLPCLSSLPLCSSKVFPIALVHLKLLCSLGPRI